MRQFLLPISSPSLVGRASLKIGADAEVAAHVPSQSRRLSLAVSPGTLSSQHGDPASPTTQTQDLRGQSDTPPLVVSFSRRLVPVALSADLESPLIHELLTLSRKACSIPKIGTPTGKAPRGLSLPSKVPISPRRGEGLSTPVGHSCAGNPGISTQRASPRVACGV